MSEYDPLLPLPSSRAQAERVQLEQMFAAAAAPYVQAPWGWLGWSIALPSAALLTTRALAAGGPSAVLALWSVVILIAGAIEAVPHMRLRRGGEVPAVAAWALRGQGNLSAVGAVLSALLLWQGEAQALPGLWLLLLGHSFVVLGSLAFKPLRTAGVLYQIGGACALWPDWPGLAIFAVTTGIANLWMFVQALRARASGD